MDSLKFKLVLILTIGFTLASILGYLTQKCRLSPLLGYLIAGYIIGPYSPGFVADLEVAEQLAEIGVVLMMFGVGLHFNWQDLIKVRGIAIPGATLQTLGSALFTILLLRWIGWPLISSIVVGISLGVASTVVMVKVLSDNKLLKTPEGHVAIGWLVVEDLFTVIALVLLPMLVTIAEGGSVSASEMVLSGFDILYKFALMAVMMFTLGRLAVNDILNVIVTLKSEELFTLTTLALIFLIAVGSSLIFGTSIALGAFIAGMIVGQSSSGHAANKAMMPLKDVFLVLFFLSVGMLFNPDAIVYHPYLFFVCLVIILVIKPIIAIGITLFLKYPLKMAVTVGIALAQIGEFSFILAEEALRLNVLPDDGYDIIVAAAMATIALNPSLFDLLNTWKKNRGLA
jgi:CPA2 family monovalent cation:H+ antiporter-2